MRGKGSLQLPRSSVRGIFVTAQLMKPASGDVFFGLLDGQPGLIAEPWCLFESPQQSLSVDPQLAVVIGTSGSYWIAAAADSVEWVAATSDNARPKHLALTEAPL